MNQISRCIRIMTALAPHVIAGLSISEIAEKTGLAAPSVYRDLDALAAEGWAGKLESGRWSLTTRPISLATACELSLRTAQERQDNFKRNARAGAFRMLEG